MDYLLISICENEHHFINSKECCFCGMPISKKILFREGDCIDCGQLCPAFGYGCSNSIPLTIDNFKNDQNKTSNQNFCVTSF